MAISEAQRFEMHLGLRKVIGDEVANTLMEHLPPSGWTDVARKQDIDVIEKRLNVVVTVSVAFGLALLALLGLQVQIMLSIANL